MSFLEDMDLDLLKVLGAEVGPGEDVTIRSKDGKQSAEIRAIFDLPGTVISLGSSAGLVSEAPALHFREMDFREALGRKIKKTDTFKIRSKAYRFDKYLPDGTGWISLKLLEV